MKVHSSDFDTTSKGFLPEECVKDLPKSLSFYQPVLDSLPETVIKGVGFRDIVHQLPKYNKRLYNVDDLSMDEIKFMYSILSMIVHRYMWCDGSENCVTNIPPEIGKIWYKCSNKLGIRCVLTHAAVDLYNWRLIDKTKPFSLDNIETNYTMTGTLSESWFYKIMIAIEGVSGRMFSKFEKLPQWMHYGDNENILQFLIDFNELLNEVKTIIKRTYDNCNSDVFFKELRVYLHGSRKAPTGKIVIKSDPTDNTDFDIDVSESGGSAAQSSLIQVFDSVFGTKHTDASLRYLKEQRHFMPEKHRTFVEIMNYTPSLRDYIIHSKSYELATAYNKCNNTFVRFRQAHFSLTGYYITKYIGEGGDINYEDLKSMCGSSSYRSPESNGECPMTGNIGKCPYSGKAIVLNYDDHDTNDYVKKYVFSKPSGDMVKAEGSGETDFRVFLPETIRSTIMNDIHIDNTYCKLSDDDNDNDNDNDDDNDNTSVISGYVFSGVCVTIAIVIKWWLWR